MPGLPVILHLRGSKCLIVGGGPVALRRAHALIAAGCTLITVVAPHIDPRLRELNVTLHERPYRETDLVDVRLVVLATDDPALHDRIARHAEALGVLVNRADDARRSEIQFMATTKAGPITLAAHTGHAIPGAARAILSELRSSLGTHWPSMLEIAAPFRQMLRDRIADIAERRRRIAALTEPAAVALYLNEGPQAYRDHCNALLVDDASDSRSTKRTQDDHDDLDDLPDSLVTPA